MRISDWSSDVCSSDLVYVVAAVAVYVTVSVLLATRYIAPANVAMNAADAAMGAALADAVTCNPTVKTFGAELREDRRVLGIADHWHQRARHDGRREINGSDAQQSDKRRGGTEYVVMCSYRWWTKP